MTKLKEHSREICYLGHKGLHVLDNHLHFLRVGRTHLLDQKRLFQRLTPRNLNDKNKLFLFMIIVNSLFTVVSHSKQWVPETDTLILFPLQKAPWPFRAVQVCLRIGLCTMENSTSWSIWSICACKFFRWSNLISWMIKQFVVLGLFQPRPPWTLEWCRCWDCCGWSW